MRKLFVAGLVGLALFVGAASAAHAQGFLLGMVVGMSMSGGGDRSIAGSDGTANANVLYVMPGVAERVRDPLSIHVVATAGGEGGCASDSARQAFGKLSLREHFARAMPQNERYEVVQVVRTMRPDGANCLILWFAFVEKDKLVALDKLAPLAQNNK